VASNSAERISRRAAIAGALRATGSPRSPASPPASLSSAVASALAVAVDGRGAGGDGSVATAPGASSAVATEGELAAAAAPTPAAAVIQVRRAPPLSPASSPSPRRWLAPASWLAAWLSGWPRRRGAVAPRRAALAPAAAATFWQRGARPGIRASTCTDEPATSATALPCLPCAPVGCLPAVQLLVALPAWRLSAVLVDLPPSSCALWWWWAEGGRLAAQETVR
jgi:hypothetical protein